MVPQSKSPPANAESQTKAPQGQPIRIELSESGGPVSPRYQYSTDLLVQGELGRLEATYEDEGEYTEKGPSRKNSFRGTVDPKRFDKLIKDLESCGAKGIESSELAPGTKERIGISFNRVSVVIENVFSFSFEYTLSELKRAPGPKKSVVEILKEFGASLSAS